MPAWGALGIALDDRKNEEASSGIREIQRENSRVKVLVIPTDEELEIARQTIETRRRKGGERARGAGYWILGNSGGCSPFSSSIPTAQALSWPGQLPLKVS